MTTGLPSTRKGSNLRGLLDSLEIDPETGEGDTWTYRTAAHLQRGTQGWQLLVFTR